jgi:ABC-type transporter Mla subunit MlaD
MTGEELERAITFALEQQAQISSNMARLTERVDRNAESVTTLLDIAEIQASEIRDLSETARDLSEVTRTVADRQHEAEERGRLTDERLNALINTVERYISEGRNGKT